MTVRSPPAIGQVLIVHTVVWQQGQMAPVEEWGDLGKVVCGPDWHESGPVGREDGMEEVSVAVVVTFKLGVWIDAAVFIFITLNKNILTQPDHQYVF